MTVKRKKTAKKKVPDKQRFDWEYNHEVLSEAFMTHLAAHGRPPTIKAMMEATGFAKQTVCNHIEELNKKTLAERLKKFKLVTDEIMGSLSLKAKRGDTAAAKLYFELAEQFKEGKEVDLNLTGTSREEKEELLGRILGKSK